MSYGLYGFIVWGVLVTLSATGLALWGWRRGQFHNVEEPKYRMLEDREPAPWPGRSPIPLAPGEPDQENGRKAGRPGASGGPAGREGAER